MLLASVDGGGLRNAIPREATAVVEIIVEKDAEVKYSTVQNWYPGDREGRGGIYNFVTKRGICRENARLSWTQVETGSAITWKYPSCILAGDNSVGEFYSVADRKSTRLNSSHSRASRMPSSA